MPKSPSRTSKKKKYNARFPPARIKKIMQTDEEVGKVAAAVPVIISRALEMFIESLMKETAKTTISKSAKTLSTSHIKQTIHSHKEFDFLRDMVASIPDHQTEDNNGDTAHHDTEPGVKKARGRPRKVKDPVIGKKERGESSKASPGTSDDDEEEDDEDTETDEEGAASSSAQSSSTSSRHPAVGNSHDRLAPSQISASGNSGPNMLAPNAPGASLPPPFTTPELSSLKKQQQLLQPHHQFHQQQQQQQQYALTGLPPFPGSTYPPYPQHPAMGNYPLPPQFQNSFMSMMPPPPEQHQYPHHQHQQQLPQHQLQGMQHISRPDLQNQQFLHQHMQQQLHQHHSHQQQYEAQPVNLSASNRAVASNGESKDDYDT